MTITSSTTIIRSADATCVEVNDECVVMSPAHGAYFGLNASASAVWALIERPIAFGDLCAKLRTEFAAEDGIIEGEARMLLEGMTASGLVEIVD